MTPELLAAIKIGLSIPADETEKDALLMQRGDLILDAMRKRTGAVLYPIRRFKEIYHGTRFEGADHMDGYTPRKHPVALLEELKINGVPVDDVSLYPVTTDGRISFYAAPYAIYSELEFTYQAGYERVPGELFDALLNLLQQYIDAIESGAIGPFTPSKISLVDVGSLEFKSGDSFTDFFGPYGAVVDAFVVGAGAGVGGEPLYRETYDLGEVVPPGP